MPQNIPFAYNSVILSTPQVDTELQINKQKLFFLDGKYGAILYG